jgi:hypothetical protein
MLTIAVTLKSRWVKWWGLSRHQNTCLGQGKTVRSLRKERPLFKDIDLTGVGGRRNYRDLRISAVDMFVNSMLSNGKEVR